jgi:hypothetical protein
MQIDDPWGSLAEMQIWYARYDGCRQRRIVIRAATGSTHRLRCGLSTLFQFITF